MNDFLTGGISAKFLYGDYTVLVPNKWKGFNVSVPSFKFYFVTKGKTVLEFEDGKITENSGELVVIPPLTRHSFYLPDDNTAEKLWFHANIRQGERDAVLPIKRKIKVDDVDKMTELFKKAISKQR
ncbi:MAG: cupin domain-containing protein [Clostridia bacterium]|nr:cupin domain-containing protein [Clostridia bacterium]